MLLFFVCMIFFVPYIVNGAESSSNPIGVNLAPIKDWSSELVFNDIFKRARAWRSIDAESMVGNHRKILVDKAGWVKRLTQNQWAITYILSGFKGHFPRQVYRCLYDGSGELDFQGVTIVKRDSGMLDISFLPDAANLALIIKKTNPNDYIRNIRIMPLNTQNKLLSQTFRGDFLSRWAKFKSIRFMDWMATNHNSNVFWDDRAMKNYFSQASKKGMALEYMIELANVLNVPPWFCMPHAATDTYIRSFAMMVKKKLNPSLSVYIEYSNEVWNGMFPAYQFARKMGVRLGMDDDKTQAGLKYYTHRSLQIFKIWKNVFGDSERLIRVLSSQAGVPWKSEVVLDWEGAFKKVDALAIAPYFGYDIHSDGFDGIDGLFRVMNRKVDQKKNLLSEYVQITRERNIKLIAYEGGQHLRVWRGEPKTDKMFDLANKDPRMYSLYKKYLSLWFESGGGVFMHYSSVGRYTRNGRWGLVEWYDQKIDPYSKYSAVIDSMGLER